MSVEARAGWQEVERLRAEVARLTAELDSLKPKTLSDAVKIARAQWYDQHGGKDTIQVAYEALEAEVARLKVPLCIGPPIISLLARDGQWISENGRGLIAADELYRHDPYAEVARER